MTNNTNETNNTIENNERLEMNYGEEVLSKDLWINWASKIHNSLKATLSPEIINFKGQPVFN
jgi:hypothetical protein